VQTLRALTVIPMLGQAMPRARVNLPKVVRAEHPWARSKHRFKKIQLLGQGSFGKAFAALLGSKAVIVKTAHGERGVVSQQEAYEALYREFVILGKLQDLSFVPRLIEVGPDYFVQEDVGGESMLRILSKKGLEAREILSVVVATGLMISKIHERGIAHRDLEPRNILLTPHGAVIIDFGIAIERSENEKLFRDGMKKDLISLMENVALAATASDITATERAIMVQVIEKFRKRVIDGDVNELTAKEFSDELLFVLAQLGARARRGKGFKQEKIKVKVI
jgi:serine/threonine protein kinase